MEDMPLYKKIALGVGAVALFGCIISGIRLVERRGDASKVGETTPEPQDITLAKLIARGPEGNAHLRVTDLVLDNQYLSKNKKTKSGVESVEYIWAVARVPGEPPGTPIRVLVKNSRVSSQSDADSFLTARVVTGLVINKIDRPSDEEVRLLRGTFSGLDPDKVVLLHAFREPPGQLARFNAIFSLVAGLIAVGCVLVAIGDMIPALFPRRKKKKKRRRRILDEDDEEDEEDD